jgi:hypothetical protein
MRSTGGAGASAASVLDARLVVSPKFHAKSELGIGQCLVDPIQVFTSQSLTLRSANSALLPTLPIAAIRLSRDKLRSVTLSAGSSSWSLTMRLLKFFLITICIGAAVGFLCSGIGDVIPSLKYKDFQISDIPIGVVFLIAGIALAKFWKIKETKEESTTVTTTKSPDGSETRTEQRTGRTVTDFHIDPKF